MEEKIAYRIEELAELGPLCRSRIYEEIGNGNLPARKSGKTTFVLAADWREYLTSRPVMRPRSLQPSAA